MTQYTGVPIRHARNPRRSFNGVKLAFVSFGIVLGTFGALYLYAWLERLSNSLAN